jgi:hypothetical protein
VALVEGAAVSVVGELLDDREKALDLLGELVDAADSHESDVDYAPIDTTLLRVIQQARILLKRPRREPADNPRG